MIWSNQDILFPLCHLPLKKYREVARVQAVVRVYDPHKPGNLCRPLNSTPLCPGEARTELRPQVSTTRVSQGPGYFSVLSCCPRALMLTQWSSPLHKSDSQSTVHFRSLGAPRGPRGSMELIMEISKRLRSEISANCLPAPSTRDRQTTLVGAHWWPYLVTQCSLSAAVTNLQGERGTFA